MTYCKETTHITLVPRLLRMLFCIYTLGSAPSQEMLSVQTIKSRVSSDMLFFSLIAFLLSICFLYCKTNQIGHVSLAIFYWVIYVPKHIELEADHMLSMTISFCVVFIHYSTSIAFSLFFSFIYMFLIDNNICMGSIFKRNQREESEKSSSILCPQLPSSHLQSKLIPYFFQETVN